jgi:hypothetical protein
MKNLKKLLVFMMLCLPFSCMDSNMVEPQPLSGASGVNAVVPPPPGGTLPDMTAFNALADTQLNIVFHDNSNYTYPLRQHLFLNYERFVRDQTGSYNTAFGSQALNATSFADGFDFSSLPTTHVKPSQVANVSTLYSAGQLIILDNFSTLMYDATGQASVTNASFLASWDVRNSTTLSNNDKIEVLAFVRVGVAFATDFFNNESDYLKTIIQTETGATPETNCRVNFRNVWAGAVVGGVANGVRGAIIGATGGTMTFPGLGTVGGALGGGVIGFATGFAGGALSGVVSELMTSCFRQAYMKSSIPAYLCDDFQEILYNPDCSEYFDRKYAAVHL